MKKVFTISIVFFLLSISMNAQGFEITPQYGYQINSKLNYNGGYIKIPASGLYGVTGSFNIGHGRAIEFSWAQQNSEIEIKDVLFDPYEERNWGDVTINHYQFGSVQHFGNDDDLRPFLGLSLGWSTFNPDNNKFSNGGNTPPYLNSTSTFTFGISGGIKYMFSDYIGLRIQSQLLMPTYAGAYYGYGYGYSKVVAMLNFSAGLIFAFGG